MKTRILPPAEADLADAVEFYISEGGFDAGGGLVDEIRRLAGVLAVWPTLGRAVEREVRVIPLRRFPFSVVYRLDHDEIVILGPRQITGTYLLALAVHHGGRFVTFDRAAPLEAVAGATASHLVAL